MLTSQTQACLALQLCPQLGPKTFQNLIKKFSNPLNTWQQSAAVWRKAGFKKSLCEAFTQHKQTFQIELILAKLKKLEIKYLPQTSSKFPKLLKQIADPPIGLFIKGEIEQFNKPMMAVVGTRRVTTYGKQVTKQLTSALTNAGFVVVSGLARGVDGIAHQACIDNGGQTIAVLGCGVDIIYPSQHQNLAKQILATGGAIISEYPPETKPIPGNFPARNRIISGMSSGVLVTEGASKSGSKITAMMALDQNREVFAVPGSINSPMSQAPADLIKLGAKLVTSIEDILEELNIKGNVGVKDPDFVPEFDNLLQEKIYKYLQQNNQHIDTLIRDLKVDSAQINVELTLLELNGLIENFGNGEWGIVRK